MLAPVKHILPVTSIVRTRVLPINGQVYVRIGQKVKPSDVLAEATIAREHLLVDVARELRLPSEQADKLIKCKVGNNLNVGDSIASVAGLFGREVKAQLSGKVVAVGGGQVLLEVEHTSIEIQAGMPGTIVDLVENRGAIVQTTGALIQGVWGNGRVDSGLMLNLCEKPADTLFPGQLDVSMRGSVVIGGHVADEKTLVVAAELPLRGLVVSSIAPELLPFAARLRLPVIVLEGFGKRAMLATTHKLLVSNMKREVSVIAERFDRLSGALPELIIPLPVSQPLGASRDMESLETGQTVHILRAPQAGEIGTLLALRPGLSKLASGVNAPAADVKLEDGQLAIIPLANMEILA